MSVEMEHISRYNGRADSYVQTLSFPPAIRKNANSQAYDHDPPGSVGTILTTFCSIVHLDRIGFNSIWPSPIERRNNPNRMIVLIAPADVKSNCL
jgi:hypothetical protein